MLQKGNNMKFFDHYNPVILISETLLKLRYGKSDKALRRSPYLILRHFEHALSSTRNNERQNLCLKTLNFMLGSSNHLLFAIW
jgi:hypothetical protein